MHVSFIDSDKKGISIQIDSILVQGLSQPLYKDSSTNKVSLPLNPEKDEAEFYFHATIEDVPAVDTIVVRYVRIPRVFSEDCDVQLYYESLEVSSHTFAPKPVRVTFPSLYTTVDSNVEITF